MRRLLIYLLEKLANIMDGLRDFSRSFFTILGLIARTRRNALAYEPRPDDVFLVSYPKSGTTWIQNIMVQLASCGEAEFDHIGDVVPFFEDCPSPESLPSPRFFKTHQAYAVLPDKAPRFIYVVRHGLDVAVSYYHHNLNLKGYNRGFEEFYRSFISGRIGFGSWFNHVKTWEENAAGRNLLFLRYEDMKDDLEGTLRQIMAFTQIQVPEAALPGILERCSFQYMKDNQEKFDLALWRARRLGLNIGNFIRKGEMHQWRETLTPDQIQAYRVLFNQRLGHSSFKDYQV